MYFDLPDNSGPYHRQGENGESKPCHAATAFCQISVSGERTCSVATWLSLPFMASEASLAGLSGLSTKVSAPAQASVSMNCALSGPNLQYDKQVAMLHTDMQEACSATEPEDQRLRCIIYDSSLRMMKRSREAHHSTEWGPYRRACGSPSAQQQECCRGRQRPPRPGGTCWRRQGAWCASQPLAPQP